MYTRILFGWLSSSVLMSCAATNPVNLVPKEDPAPATAEEASANLHSVSVQSMLARVRNPSQLNTESSANNNFDPIVTLHYTEKQKVLLPLQKQQINTLLVAVENSGIASILQIHVGPGDVKDPIESLRVGQHRAQYLQHYLTEKTIESKINYDPHLPLGVIVVELEEQGGKNGH